MTESRKPKKKIKYIELNPGDQITYSFGATLELNKQWQRVDLGISRIIRMDDDPEEVLESLIDFIERRVEKKLKEIIDST